MSAAAQHVGFRAGLLECGMNTFAVTGRVRFLLTATRGVIMGYSTGTLRVLQRTPSQRLLDYSIRRLLVSSSGLASPAGGREREREGGKTESERARELGAGVHRICARLGVHALPVYVHCEGALRSPPLFRTAQHRGAPKTV